MDIIPREILLDAIENPNPEGLLEWLSAQRQKQMIAQNKQHLLVRVQKVLDLSGVEGACVGYYHSGGRGAPPTYTVGIMIRALIIGTLRGLSLRELEGYINESGIAKWFVGLQDHQVSPDHSTLERFSCLVNALKNLANF